MPRNLPRSLAASLLAASVLASAVLPVGAADDPNVLGQVVSTDIVAYIDGSAIPSYNYNSDTMIVAEELLNYGFDVVYDNSDRSLRISKNADKPQSAAYVPEKSTQPVGTPLMNVLRTDIKTYIEGQYVRSYNVGGLTVIGMDSLASFYPANYVWDGEARTLSFDTRGQQWENTFMTAVASAVANHEDSITLKLPTQDIDKLNDMLSVYDMNTAAWTHFAWVSRWVHTRPLTTITVSISYIADEATIAQIDAVIDGIVEKAMTFDNDYDRILYIHDTVCEMTVYDQSYVEDQGNPDAYKQNRYHIPGVVLDGLAVCQGYTETIDYILKKCGIKCDIALNSWHSWNIVYLDGVSYHIDATWNDADESGTIYRRYFMRSAEQIMKTREYEPRPDENLNDDSFAWMRLNGHYFKTGDFSAIEPLIVDAIKGRRHLELEFASPEEAARFHKSAIDRYMVFDLLEQLGIKDQSFYYTYEEDSSFYNLDFSGIS